MPQRNAIDSLSRTLQVIKLMSRENGATVTEIANSTGIDRWTVKDMIDRMEHFYPDGKGLFIREIIPVEDKRQIRYKVEKESLWTLTLPGMDLSEDEAILLELMFNQNSCSPVLKDASESLKRKLNMFKNIPEYEIMNVNTIKKVATKQTKQIMTRILKAIHNGQCIKLSYKPVRREVTCYDLLPLGVFKYNFGFYLAAQKLPNGEFRTFGLERVTEIPEAFDFSGQLPEKKDYLDAFNDPFGPFGHDKEFEAVLKFDSLHGFYNLEKNWPKAVKISEQEDETVIMNVKTKSEVGIKNFILSFGSGVEVLQPQWLREEMKEEYKKIISLYEKD